jgi:outer membrane protein OmpA-like peptidoglycan-associated protein
MKVGTLVLSLVAAAFLVAGTGCADKVTAERDSLQAQNKQLSDQLTAEREARQLAESQLKNQQPVASAPAEQAPDMTGGPMVMDGSGLHRATPGKPGAATPSKGGTQVKAAAPSRITLPGHVLFGSGKTTLDATATKTLDTMVATIKSKYAGDKLVIEGFTDATPPSKNSVWKSNEDLAKARATSVKNYLVKKGVKAEMTVKAVGAADNKDAAQARRVEVVVVDTK